MWKYLKPRWARMASRGCLRFGRPARTGARLSLQSLDERAVPAVITVTDNGDVVAVDAKVTLREAILSINNGANLNADVVANVAAFNFGANDEIRFDPVAFAAAKTITMAKGEFAIDQDVAIIGPAAKLTINAGGTSRVFSVGPANGNPVVEIKNLTLANGSAAKDHGGAVCVFSGDLTLDNCVVRGSTAQYGGGIAQRTGSGTLTLSRTTVEENAAQNDPLIGPGLGGGLFISETAVIFASTFSGNTAESGGGGVCIVASPLVVIANSTVSGNTANGGYPYPQPWPLWPQSPDGLGGGILGIAVAAGSFEINNSTVALNEAKVDGGGIAWLAGGGFQTESTVVAQNTASRVITCDLWSSAAINVPGDANLVGIADKANGVTLAGMGNKTGTAIGPGLPGPLNPLLGPLANNGGPTKTHALLAGSPAINVGGNPLNLNFDQRGLAREVPVGVPDIGAFEVQPPPKMGGCVINAGAAQRSRVTQVQVDFDQVVNLPANPAYAFQLKRQGDNALVGLTAIVVNDATTHVSLTFSGPATAFGSLADGRYSLTVYAAQVTAAGVPLDGNGDGAAGDDYVIAGDPAAPSPEGRLFRLFGDGDGDGDVDSTDFLAMRSAFLTGSNSAFDSDADGDVDAFDFLQFRTRFGAAI